jgi:hypothetical protein
MNWTDAELQDVFSKVAQRAAIDPEFRREALSDPNLAISRITTKLLPPGMAVKFVDNSGQLKTIPLPDPAAEISLEELSEEDLEAVAGGIDVTAGITVGIGGGKKRQPAPPKPPQSPS